MIFGKKYKKKRLEKKYRNLMSQAYRLSTTDRAASDQKTAEANLVLQQIEALK